MKDNGYLYILLNPSMKNLVQIKRANELSSTIEVPTPFIVVYSCYFENCSDAEAFVHTYLENKNLRVSSNREFFDISIQNAIDLVIQAKEHLEKFSISIIDNEFDYIEPWNDILDKALSYRYGLDDIIEDKNDAIKYYLKAIKLGYLDGYLDLGQLMENDKKALYYYKLGIENGIHKCYAPMGSYYFKEEDYEKALKCYSLYIKNVKKEEYMDAYIADYLFLSMYDIECNDNELEIEYMDKILIHKDKVLKYIKMSYWVCKIFSKEYEHFYQLPIAIRNAITSNKYKKNNDEYITAQYRINFIIKEGFLECITDMFLDEGKFNINKDYIIFEIRII